VLNKIDLPAADPEKYAAELANLIGGKPEDVLRVSGKTGMGVEELLDRIVEQLFSTGMIWRSFSSAR
jgi:GTP-binding protein LepA